jgi:phospho-N-acetylmuramoyl-pentapeptide-transferase
VRTSALAAFSWVDFVVGFALAACTCAIELPILRRLQFRQHAYEDAPQTHQKKTGTPTMGGIAFVVALIPLLIAYRNPFSIALFFLVAACGLIGFIDDYTAIRRGKNAGLRARTKYLLTAVAAALFLWQAGVLPALSDVLLRIPGFTLHVPHWLWLLLGIAAVTGTIHAVNLTDGLDGLATGTMIPPLLAFYAMVAVFPQSFLAAGNDTLGLIAVQFGSALGIGACFGFLLYNRHPAKIFMGDTGSLALGALLSGVAILSGQMLLLVVIGGVFVAEALSVIIQVTYFKRTGGKRIFRMSPLHHHFELVGWPETKVTGRFWLASLALSFIGLAIVR